jgi:hypothetical protein
MSNRIFIDFRNKIRVQWIWFSCNPCLIGSLGIRRREPTEETGAVQKFRDVRMDVIDLFHGERGKMPLEKHL